MTRKRESAASTELTTKGHWEDAWIAPPRWRLPSPLIVGTRNLQRILRPEVQPGMRVLELGCAPGKMLAWVAAGLRAQVSGLDYSDRGIDWARQLTRKLGIPADLRAEDVFHTSFPPASFDLVYSFGLIEHFDDPREIVRAHVGLARPGGTVIIGVPHYGGLYGRLQHWFDPENLALHNLSIMNPRGLEELAPRDLVESARGYAAGRVSPWLVNFDRRVPSVAARLLSYALNGVGLLQPVDVPPLCPLLVLRLIRRREDAC